MESRPCSAAVCIVWTERTCLGDQTSLHYRWHLYIGSVAQRQRCNVFVAQAQLFAAVPAHSLGKYLPALQKYRSPEWKPVQTAQRGGGRRVQTDQHSSLIVTLIFILILQIKWTHPQETTTLLISTMPNTTTAIEAKASDGTFCQYTSRGASPKHSITWILPRLSISSNVTILPFQITR